MALPLLQVCHKPSSQNLYSDESHTAATSFQSTSTQVQVYGFYGAFLFRCSPEVGQGLLGLFPHPAVAILLRHTAQPLDDARVARAEDRQGFDRLRRVRSVSLPAVLDSLLAISRLTKYEFHKAFSASKWTKCEFHTAFQPPNGPNVSFTQRFRAVHGIHNPTSLSG